jgi:capsular polysaccharide transport system permease protein
VNIPIDAVSPESVAGDSFFRGLRVQLRVIGALFLREIITRFGRDNLGFVWLFLEPMIFTLSVTALWSATKITELSTLPIVAFTLTGYSSVLLWRNCTSHCCNAIASNIGLLHHRPVRVIDVLITKIILEVAGATLSFVALSTLWISIGWADLPVDMLTVVGGWLLLIWFGGSLALIIGALTAYSEIAERFWHPTAYILFPMSGAVFMVDWLSSDFQKLVLLLPMVHCTEMIRDGFFGPAVRTHYDVTYVAVICLVMTAAGLALVRGAARRVEIR